MHRYSVFGHCIASAMPLPRFPQASGAVPAWLFTEVARLPDAQESTVLSRLAVGSCTFELSRAGAAFRFVHSCSGAYAIDPSSGRVDWVRAPGVVVDQAEADLVSRILPLLLHARGYLCLHGSGVLTESGAVAFLADSGTGKSTIANALVAAGATLLADDAVVVDVSSTPCALPGVRTVRLNDDSAGVLLDDHRSLPMSRDGKYVIRQPALDASARMPLRAVYVLRRDPTGAQTENIVTRELPPSVAALTLLRHDKLLGLLGPSEGPELLSRSASVARAVPVIELSVIRRLDRVREAAAELLSRHSPPRAAPRAAR